MEEGRMGEPPSRRLNRTFTMGGLSELVDSEVVPSSLSSIAPILRVANEIEKENPRVAYLCRFYAFEKAHKLDSTSSGRGVRQFKTALLQRLERDNEPTAQKKQRKTDAREMQYFYEQYYDKYVKARDENPNQIDRAQLSRVYQTAYILFEVLQNVTVTQSEIIDPKIVKAAEDVGKKKEIYIPYNILPLDPTSKSQAIMQLPEIKVAVSILCNTRGLSWPQDKNQSVRGTDLDLLDWLEVMFGFQKDNVANQREHIILLLANLHIRLAKNPEAETKLDESVLNHVIKRLFKNYRNWCKFLGRDNHLDLPFTRPEIQQRQILYVGLYLLIWGEAANLRFMPECLCYIFHHMAHELSGTLDARVSPLTGENIKPAYGGSKDAFLRKVIMPIYRVIEKEAQTNKNCTSDHSSWRNYDDLNEYFWSIDCFNLGWPMRADADFFACPNEEKNNRGTSFEGDLSSTKKRRWAGKTSFVEIRSFWHIIRSFDRMWAFLILSLQAMIVIAWNGSGSPLAIFDRSVFKKVLSITITSAFLRLLQVILDLALNIRAFRSMRITDIIRYVLKLIVAIAWAIILPVSYLQTWDNLYEWLGTIKNWFSGTVSPSFFYTAILIYVAPNVLGSLFFLFPILRRWTENSNWRIVEFLLWWSQPKLYTGRGMHESFVDLFKYTCFWILLLLSKFLFSFYVEVKPLIDPTRQIMLLTIDSYSWHELFPTVNGNFGVVLSLWAPVILVYFMDIQIWYAVCSTVFGGITGAFSHLGEIRTLDMLRSRFRALPDAFNTNLVPSDKKVSKRNSFASQKYEKPSNDKTVTETVAFAKFALLWNEVITAFRNEDFINNSEMDLLLVPYSLDSIYGVVQWPPFLLASKILQALDMVNEFEGTHDDLNRRLSQDEYMRDAVTECYKSLKHVLSVIIKGKTETEVIGKIFEKVEAGSQKDNFCQTFNMNTLPVIYQKFTELVTILKEGDLKDQQRVVFLLQDMYELVTKDFIPEEQAESYLSNDPSLFQFGDVSFLSNDPNLIRSRDYINFPPEKSDAWVKQIDRLHLLLTTEENAINVPTNLEAHRRIAFFTNSLFMGMPRAPKVRKMLSFSVLTPYYGEEILYDKDQLELENDDGVSILFYLQRIYPDEWKNFLERIKCPPDVDPLLENELAVRHWVSYRAQTLTRTVRGMMYYRRALELQAFLDTATDTEILGGFKTVPDVEKSPESLHARLQAVVDMKFTYVVTCQNYGIHKRAGDPRANEIIALMNTYPSLRVAYIDEVEERKDEKTIKEYYSVLVKAAEKLDQEEAKLDQVIYKIKLPGNPKIGEGKPENQNHAIIFTRGDALQAIDMNQDNYLEEAFKMRNLLQEFLKHYGVRYPSILGVREHIFTGSVSSLAWFMSNQESSFVTIGQRVLANPLKVRFHYGHPDVFDRLFHIGIGGISKASKVINLSEDIFAGFNTTLRKGNVTHHEYIQVGKGRDVGLNQISLFEAKIANGNGEQTLSRDVYRLGHRFDFFRMLSFYFTTIGFYFGSLIVVLTVYVFLYGRLYLALSGLEKKVAEQASLQINEPLQAALASQSFVQLGFLMALPMVMELGLEKGFQLALSDFIVMQLQLASVFFTFSLGTKVHYYGRTILHGGSKYRATGRGFVVFHEKFAENYRLYSRTHFTKGSELMILLLIYQIYGNSYASTAASLLVNISLWFMVGTWLYAPFLFNPSGFEWQKIVDDWDDWNKWIKNKGSVGVPSNKSWESWWNEEMDHLKFSGFRGRVIEVVMSLRFFLYQYGLVYHLHIARGNKSIWVYGISWLVLLVILVFLKIISVGRLKFRAEYQLLFRLVKGLLLIGCLAVLIILFIVGGLTIGDLFVCVLAFLPSGWALLQIAQACKPFVKYIGVWESVKALARGYDYLMGLLLFFPVAVLAWFPFVSEFQTRLLYNQAFSRGLQISRILAGRKK